MIELDSFIPGQTVFGANEDLPGQLRWQAISFLVEIISDWSNRLTQDQCGGQNVEQFTKTQFIFTTENEQTKHPANKCAWETKSTDPDREQIQMMGKIMRG